MHVTGEWRTHRENVAVTSVSKTRLNWPVLCWFWLLSGPSGLKKGWGGGRGGGPKTTLNNWPLLCWFWLLSRPAWLKKLLSEDARSTSCSWFRDDQFVGSACFTVSISPAQRFSACEICAHSHWGTLLRCSKSSCACLRPKAGYTRSKSSGVSSASPVPL